MKADHTKSLRIRDSKGYLACKNANKAMDTGVSGVYKRFEGMKMRFDDMSEEL